MVYSGVRTWFRLVTYACDPTAETYAGAVDPWANGTAACGFRDNGEGTQVESAATGAVVTYLRLADVGSGDPRDPEA